MKFAGIPERGGYSRKFVQFTPDEIERHISLYIFQGLNPSPRVTMKMKTQNMEPLQGCDAIAEAMGPNAEHRHREFRKYFCLQHPHKPCPSKTSHPTWKVDPFLRHLNLVFLQAMKLPENLSGDEQTRAFQGSSQFKSRIKFKRCGDGFQCDCLCSKGYTVCFYFRFQPPPKKYIDTGLSPLHSRMMFLFDQLKEKHHCVFMDNLYMSALFAKIAINGKNKVKIHGVTRNDKKGLPKCIGQIELSNEKMVQKYQNTIKVAKLEGDPAITNLIAISYYDSKPVYFLSTVINRINWITVEKKVFSKKFGQMIKMPFLRPNFVDKYNQDMNAVDRADQLRTNYEFGLNTRNTKWWWALFFWSFDVALVNSYICYKKWHLMHQLKPISHYRYREMVALAWINPDKYWPNRYGKQRSDAGTTRSVSTCSSSQTPSTGISTLSSGSSTITTRSSKNKNVHKKRKLARVFTENALDDGKFDLRLSLSAEAPHLCMPVHSKHSICQLHNWAGKRTRKQLLYCPDCRICLCVYCYKVFHTVANLKMIKSEINNETDRPLLLEIDNNASSSFDIITQV